MLSCVSNSGSGGIEPECSLEQLEGVSASGEVISKTPPDAVPGFVDIGVELGSIGCGNLRRGRGRGRAYVRGEIGQDEIGLVSDSGNKG